MHRAIFFASLCAVGVMSAHAAELCVACQEPAATYRCTVEQPSDKYKLGNDLEAQVCTKVLAQKGEHKKCALTPVAEGGKGLQRAIETVRARVSQAIDEGYKVVVLSDRGSTTALAPIPMLLATAAVHHHLLRAKTRTRVGLVVETGEAREVHHLCLLLGFGAAAINRHRDASACSRHCGP